MQNRERINIYLKVFVLGNLYTALYEYINILPDSPWPRVEQFDKNLGENLLVIVFRGI